MCVDQVMGIERLFVALTSQFNGICACLSLTPACSLYKFVRLRCIEHFAYVHLMPRAFFSFSPQLKATNVQSMARQIPSEQKERETKIVTNLIICRQMCCFVCGRMHVMRDIEHPNWDQSKWP